MRHRNALAAAVLVTLLIAVTVLIARDEIVSGDEPEAGAAVVATATEIPLVNLVQTTDGRQVAVPAGSLDQRGYEDDDDDEHEEHEEEDDDD
jgi:hypothetical protein